MCLRSCNLTSFGEIWGGAKDILGGDVAGGLHRIVSGAGAAFAPMTPLVAPAALAAPVSTGVAIGAGLAGQKAATSAATAIGATPKQAQLTGDIASFAAPTLAGKAGELVDQAIGPRVGQALQESAEAQYARVLAPSPSQKVITQKQVVPGLLQREVKATSLKGLSETAEQNVQKFGQAINDAWSALPQTTKVELQPMLDQLDSAAADTFTVSSAAGPRPTSAYAKNALDSVDGLKQVLTDVAEKNPQTGQLDVPVERLRTLRQAWDDIATQAKVYEGQQLADYAQRKIHAMAADAIRDELGKQFPSIDVLNQEYSFWKNTQDVVDSTLLGRVGQAKPLGRKLAGAAGTAAGFATGGVGGAVLEREAMDALEKTVTSPAWNTVSAVMKTKLANSLASGNTTTALNLLRAIGIGAGIEAGDESENTTPLPYNQARATK